MINKEQAMRRLIHAAIRNIIFEEDPVSVHVTVMAAHEMLRYYVQAKKLEVRDFVSTIKPEHRKSVMDRLNEGYNFLRHARNDPEATFEEGHLHGANKAATFVNCATFQQIFGYFTAHMIYFRAIQAMERPELIGDSAVREHLLREANIPAPERPTAFRNAFDQMPQLQKERQEDTALSRAG